VNIGIVCYASVGGSGIVATSLAQSLAARGHDVHVLSADTPFRLGEYQPGLTFHRVHTPAYPLFREPQYLLSLANRIVQVARDCGLDIVHAHYAVPHATAVYLARQILLASRAPSVPRSVTTLHGTDITVVGGDRSYSETVAFSIDQSDGVTAVSESLRTDTYRVLPVQQRIEVVPNFLDCSVYRWVPADAVRARYSREGREKLIIHVSNFRPVKRVNRVIDVFARIAGRVPARLLLVGDGPDLGNALEHAKESGVGHLVESLGEQDQVVPLLSAADVFLLPSEQESFGLAALEAMACELPVVASRVGGLPEVIEDGVSGFLCPEDDLDGMAERSLQLLTDRSLHARIAAEGRSIVEERFCSERIVPRYEALYERLMGARRSAMV
jgi:N-acetyl-alpha-D-glucosaminyl L-malate synthase BshA